MSVNKFGCRATLGLSFGFSWGNLGLKSGWGWGWSLGGVEVKVELSWGWNGVYGWGRGCIGFVD